MPNNNRLQSILEKRRQRHQIKSEKKDSKEEKKETKRDYRLEKINAVKEKIYAVAAKKEVVVFNYSSCDSSLLSHFQRRV